MEKAEIDKRNADLEFKGRVMQYLEGELKEMFHETNLWTALIMEIAESGLYGQTEGGLKHILSSFRETLNKLIDG